MYETSRSFMIPAHVELMYTVGMDTNLHKIVCREIYTNLGGDKTYVTTTVAAMQMKKV